MNSELEKAYLEVIEADAAAQSATDRCANLATATRFCNPQDFGKAFIRANDSNLARIEAHNKAVEKRTAYEALKAKVAALPAAPAAQ